ncbi:MAG: hypothetical protein QF441_07045 [Bacteriovoracaceae bacterium]|jgi:hypothetical protein|nr:hypothetical protein [Bacteriovoracaceae bacterium]
MNIFSIFFSLYLFLLSSLTFSQNLDESALEQIDSESERNELNQIENNFPKNKREHLIEIDDSFLSPKEREQFRVIELSFIKGETLAKVIGLFVKADSIISRREPMVQKTLNYNSHIKDWRKISEGETIRLFINKNFIDEKKYKEFVTSSVKREDGKKENQERPYFHQFSLQYGSLSIDKSPETLSMSFAKFAYYYTNKLFDGYKYRAGIKLTRFTNFEYTGAANALSPSDFYSEFVLEINKQDPLKEKWFIGLQYDILNYFVIGGKTNVDITFSTVYLHRLALKNFYRFKDQLGFFAHLGALTAFEKSISGIDISLGPHYRFGHRHRYSLILAAYISSLDTESSNETSQAFSASLGVNF